ncbi:hypothetical protein ACHAXR_011986 [Thalassiosira sp. AJA248-18]
MVLRSGIVAHPARVDGISRRRSCVPAPLPTLLTPPRHMSSLAARSSLANSAASTGNHSAAAVAAAYYGSPSPSHPRKTLRSSPTSVTSDMLFGVARAAAGGCHRSGSSKQGPTMDNKIERDSILPNRRRQPRSHPSPLGGGGGGSGSTQPTPQNIKDNPERLARVKTEMCSYFENDGAESCPYGKNCELTGNLLAKNRHYAHGKHELKFRCTTLKLMESTGQIVNANTYLARPCMTWVSTGACPFGRRCAAIHDPSVGGLLQNPAWLPAAVSNTNAHVVVDRFAAHRENTVHQENPLISQNIWENCRPSHRGRTDKRAGSSKFDIEQEWCDTYALVCNSGVPIYGEVNSAPLRKLSDLQKLCIVLLMHTRDGLFMKESSSQLHRDYVFAPTHSLHSELCMLLQARYFLLNDDFVSHAAKVSPRDIVKEISFSEYKSLKTPWSTTAHRFDPSHCVTAHEVAFAPMGDHQANVSIWFNVAPIPLMQSQIKRSRRLKQKKKAQVCNGHTHPNANGSLISRTSSVDFPSGPTNTEPFVPMMPAENNDDGHSLIMAIIEHRIDSIILGEEHMNKLYMRMNELKNAFMGMKNFHENWMWPKREGMDHVIATTMAPPGNIMPYIPLKTNKKSPCLHNWHTFTKTVEILNTHADKDHSFVNDGTNRLSVFLSFDRKIPCTDQSGKASLPVITRNWWNVEANSCSENGTWKEILLGLQENGMWEAALRLHHKKRDNTADNTIMARNMPLSTIPFVQP